jgi:hypothetical protein
MSDCRAPGAKITMTCRVYRAWARNMLRDFASIEIIEIGLTIHDIAIHEKGGARWVNAFAGGIS